MVHARGCWQEARVAFLTAQASAEPRRCPRDSQRASPEGVIEREGGGGVPLLTPGFLTRSEEHTSELQSLQ